MGKRRQGGKQDLRDLLVGSLADFVLPGEQASQGPQGQASILLHADHQWQKFILEFPQVLLVAK